MRSTSILLTLLLTVYINAYLQAQPYFTSDCSPRTVCVTAGNCNAAFVNIATTAIGTCNGALPNYTWQLDLNNDISINRLGSGHTFSDTLPVGTHRIIFRAIDQCFLVGFCEVLVTVKDCIPPNITAISGFAATLNPGDSCRLRISVSDYIFNYSDNCTPQNQVQLRMRRQGTGTGFPTDTSAIFGRCDHGTNILELWARDNAGNLNQVNAYILVQDPQNVCPCDTLTPPPPPPPPPPPTNITLGCVVWPDSTPFNGLLYRANLQTSTPNLPLSGIFVGVDTTDMTCFTGPSINPSGNNQFFLYLEKNDSAHYEINTLDALLIQRHILGLAIITNPFALKAADVNNTVSITSGDILEMRKLIIGATTQLPVPSFQFFSRRVFSAYGKLSPLDTIVNGSLPPYHFIAIKSGNVDKFMKKSFSAPLDRSTTVLTLEHLQEDGHLSIRMVDQPYLGGQFALRFNPAEVSLVPGTYSDYEVTVVQPGEARILMLSENGQPKDFQVNIPAFSHTGRSAKFVLSTEFEALAVALNKEDLVEYRIALSQTEQAQTDRLFPNPVKSGQKVHLGTPDAAIRLVNIAGSLTYDTLVDAEGWFQTAGIIPGVYLVNSGSRTYKLVVVE